MLLEGAPASPLLGRLPSEARFLKTRALACTARFSGSDSSSSPQRREPLLHTARIGSAGQAVAAPLPPRCSPFTGCRRCERRHPPRLALAGAPERAEPSSPPPGPQTSQD